MHYFAITALAAFVATAAALPAASKVVARQEQPLEPLAIWSVVDWNEGCSPGGCIASYRVSAPAGYLPGAPAFDVVCNPVYIQGGWKACSPADQEVRPPESEDEPTVNPLAPWVEAVWYGAEDRELQLVTVAHMWYEDQTRNNATAWLEKDAATTEFDLPVNQHSQVL